MKKSWAIWPFLFFVFLSLLTPFWVFKDLLFPFITSKAFYFRICIELALPFFAYLVLTDRRFKLVKGNYLSMALLAFLAFNFVSAVVGVNPLKSFWGNFERMGGVFYLAHLTMLYFYVLLIGQLEGNYLKRFLQAFVGVSVILSINGIFGSWGWPTLTADPSLPDRVSSTFGNPIFFASYLILPLFFTVFMGIEEESWLKRGLWGIAALLQLWGIFLSATRGAAVGLIIGGFLSAVLYVLLSKQRRVKLYGSVVVGAIVLAIGILFAMSGKIPQGTALYRLTHLRDSNSSARLIQWRSALEGYKEKPVFGVGPENYMVVSNKFYNPEMYKYDASWFDKPHNYQLEILVTTGTFGFAAYAAVVLLTLWGFYRAYRADYVSLLQFCALVAATVAYHIQNLFVFDTVSPSVAFFIFTGFAGYLFYISKSETEPRPKTASVVNPTFAYTVTGLIGAAALYTLYIGNVTGIQAAHDVNYGFAYSSAPAATAKDYARNVETADGYFKEAVDSPFNFDPAETANKYGDFASRIAQDQSKGLDVEVQKRIINDATVYQEKVANRIENDPIVWQKLGYSYMLQAYANESGDFSKSEAAINKSIELAPKRVEARLGLVQLRISQQKFDDVEKLVKDVLDINPNRPDLKFQMGLIYLYTDKLDEGIAWTEQSLKEGFTPPDVRQVDMLADAYRKKNLQGRILPLYENFAKEQPNNIAAYIALAKAYAEAGDTEKARLLAQQIVQASPESAAELGNLVLQAATTTK